MAGNFRVYAFGVVGINDQTEDLEEILKEIEADELEDRVKHVGNHEVRVEHIEKKDGLWHLDFVKFRDVHGPGKGSKKTEISGFKFKKGEVFCEETAIIYCPKTSYILMQYNHHGVRYAAIEEYFSIYSNDAENKYELQPKYDEDVDRKFNTRSSIKKLTIAIDPRMLTEKDRKANTALSQAVELGDKSNASKIEITITAGREKKSTLSKFVDKTADHVKKVFERDPDSVSKLQAGIIGDVDAKVQVLDLIAQRLSRNFNNLEVGEDMRWPRSKRYDAILRARRGWKKVLV